ncbi:hypothetical protein JZ751_028995 [Albula glossodonta]|uniref:Uncharacterized protein n=1 Tax=Albula glossodonta TaxID=121402 RepID=A0A8T2PGS0_9TELE|nr:hypothetical protein JZ751_028995 [Albula glossodonta]
MLEHRMKRERERERERERQRERERDRGTQCGAVPGGQVGTEEQRAGACLSPLAHWPLQLQEQLRTAAGFGICSALWLRSWVTSTHTAPGLSETREKRSMPNWSLSASDFFGWVEQLRSQAGYDRIEDLARTFWAHFPSANRLGYDTPDPEE